MKKRRNSKNSINQNQKSFFFEDYFQTSLKQKKKQNSHVSEDRLYLLFIFFFSLISIFSISIISTSLQKTSLVDAKKNNLFFSTLRRDIVDRNGEIISRNINSYHAAVKTSLIKNKKFFLK